MFQYPREMGVATSVFPTNTEHMTWTLRQLCCLCASVCTPFTTVRVTMIPRRHGKIQNRKLHFSLDTFTHATFIFEKKQAGFCSTWTSANCTSFFLRQHTGLSIRCVATRPAAWNAATSSTGESGPTIETVLAC